MKPEIFNLIIYSKVFSHVRSYVLRNSGTFVDVEDTLQEGLLIFFNIAKRAHFILTTTPESLIYNICTKIWLKELRRRKKLEDKNFQFELKDKIINNSHEYEKRKDILIAIIEKNIKKLSPKCQEVFSYRKDGLSCEEISELMGFKNSQIAKDKFYRCKMRLIKLIHQDQDYINLS